MSDSAPPDAAAAEVPVDAVADPGAETPPMAASAAESGEGQDPAVPPAWVAQVVRWHNRHPLARRIAASDVGLFGRVALPFSAAAGKLPQRALFSAKGLIPGASQRSLATFARRHGVADPPGPPVWPERQVPAEGSKAGQIEPQWRYLLSAAIRKPGASGESARVLVAPNAASGRQAVLGRRQWSRARWGVAAGLITALIAGILAAAWGGRHLGAAAGTPGPTVSPGASATAAASSAQAPPLRSAAASNAGAAAAASAASTAVAAAAGASGPVSALNVSDRDAASHATPSDAGAGVAGRPPSDSPAERSRSATPPLAASRASAAASAAALAQKKDVAASGPVPAAPVSPDASAESRSVDLPSRQILPIRPHRRPLHALPEGATAPAQVHFALASAPMPNAVDARLQQRRLRAALGPDSAAMKIDVMSTPRGQVITVWPLPSRAAAERLARELERQGVPMSTVEF
jgi:hypothetical protein